MADAELSPSMSRAQLIAIHREYCDYDLAGGSLARASLFIRATRMLIATPVKRTSSQIRGEEVELDPTITAAQLKRAEDWYLKNYARLSGTQLPTQYTIDEDWRA